MIYNIVHPIVATINGDDLKEAIKNYVKLNHHLNLTNLIIQNQKLKYNADIKYYMENNRRKANISLSSFNHPIGLSNLHPSVDPFIQPLPSSIPPYPLSDNFLSPISSLSPTQFMPMVIKIKND